MAERGWSEDATEADSGSREGQGDRELEAGSLMKNYRLLFVFLACSFLSDDLFLLHRTRTYQV